MQPQNGLHSIGNTFSVHMGGSAFLTFENLSHLQILGVLFGSPLSNPSHLMLVSDNLMDLIPTTTGVGHVNHYTKEVQKSTSSNSSLQSAKMIIFIKECFCQLLNYDSPLSQTFNHRQGLEGLKRFHIGEDVAL